MSSKAVRASQRNYVSKIQSKSKQNKNQTSDWETLADFFFQYFLRQLLWLNVFSCVWVCMYVSVSACIHMWRPEEGVRYPSQSPSVWFPCGRVSSLTWSLWALLLQQAHHQQTPDILRSLPFLSAGVTGIGGPCPGVTWMLGPKLYKVFMTWGFLASSGWCDPWVGGPGSHKEAVVASLSATGLGYSGKNGSTCPPERLRTPLHLSCSQTRRSGCLYFCHSSGSMDIRAPPFQDWFISLIVPNLPLFFSFLFCVCWSWKKKKRVRMH